MKNQLIKTFSIFTLISSVFISCNTDESENGYDHALEYKQKNNAFLKEYTAKISGSWKVEKMVLVTNNMSDIIKKDTILYNIGTIDINLEEKEMWDNRLRFFLNGYFHINKEIIPFNSSLIIPQYADKSIVSLIEVNPVYFPEPVMDYNLLTKEYHLLDGYFFDDNYTMTFSEDGKTWTWKGLNRSAKEIVLTKID